MAFQWLVFGHRARDLETGRFLSMDDVFSRGIEERIEAAREIISQNEGLQEGVFTIMEKHGASEEQAYRILGRTISQRTRSEGFAAYGAAFDAEGVKFRG